jgi:hypothetical protein
MRTVRPLRENHEHYRGIWNDIEEGTGMTRTLLAALAMASLVMLQPLRVGAAPVISVEIPDSLLIGRFFLSGHGSGILGASSGESAALPGITDNTGGPQSIITSTTITDSIVNIADPGTGLVSDVIEISVQADQLFYSVSLTSDSSLTPLGGPCSLTAQGCLFTETGGLQTLGTVTWSDGDVDTIYFKSDIDAVPEPASLLLLVIGCAGMVWNLRQRAPAQSCRTL